MTDERDRPWDPLLRALQFNVLRPTPRPTLARLLARDPRFFLPIAGHLVAGLEILSLDVRVPWFGHGGRADVSFRPVPFDARPVSAVGRARIAFEDDATSTSTKEFAPRAWRSPYAIHVLERTVDLAAIPAADRIAIGDWSHAPLPIPRDAALFLLLHERVCATREGRPVETLAIEVREGESLVIDVHWTERALGWGMVHPYVIVEANGAIVAETKDEGLVRQTLTIEAPSPGLHLVHVTSRSGRARGYVEATIKASSRSAAAPASRA